MSESHVTRPSLLLRMRDAFLIKTSSAPRQLRGTTAIDLFRSVENSSAKAIVAHGVFSMRVDELIMWLAPSDMALPNNWYLMPPGSERNGDRSITLDFLRADDMTMLQGEWTPVANNVSLQIAIRGNQLTAVVPSGFDSESIGHLPVDSKLRTIKIDPTQKPKRITVSSPPTNGIIELIEGIYRIESDRLTIAFGSNGQVPTDFDKDKVELVRVKR